MSTEAIKQKHQECKPINTFPEFLLIRSSAAATAQLARDNMTEAVTKQRVNNDAVFRIRSPSDDSDDDDDICSDPKASSNKWRAGPWGQVRKPEKASSVLSTRNYLIPWRDGQCLFLPWLQPLTEGRIPSYRRTVRSVHISHKQAGQETKLCWCVRWELYPQPVHIMMMAGEFVNSLYTRKHPCTHACTHACTHTQTHKW